MARRFHLIRDVDHTGVSGTGTVAEGVEFTDGRTVLAWVVPPAQSIAIWRSIDDAMHVHGHDGATRLEWVDE